VMELTLMELRRYAIENRLAIRFGEGSQICIMNDRGQLRLEDVNQDIRIERVLESAERFEIVRGEQSEPLSRETLVGRIEDMLKARRSGHSQSAIHEDE
jgi:hypothetical protein